MRLILGASDLWAQLESDNKKAWITYFRTYGPTEAYFDKSWLLPDIDDVN